MRQFGNVLNHQQTWLDTSVSTLILTVPQLVQIQSGPDGQVQTIFGIDSVCCKIGGGNPFARELREQPV